MPLGSVSFQIVQGDVWERRISKIAERAKEIVANATESGSGNPSTFVPPLAGSDIVDVAGPNRLIRLVLDGLSGPLKVNGADFGTAAMPPWKPAMNDTEIAAVLTYIRGSWGNKASAVTPEQAAAIRAKEKARNDPWTWIELEKISEKD